MSYFGDKRLSGRKLKAAMLLSEGFSLRDVAAALGMSHTGLHAWTCDPKFRAEVERQHDNERGRMQGQAAKRTEATWRMIDKALEATEGNTPEGEPL